MPVDPRSLVDVALDLSATLAAEDRYRRLLLAIRRVLPSKVGGMGRTRWAVRRFDVEHLGRYRLQVGPLSPEAELSRWKLVFTRPHGGRLTLAVLAIVAGSLLLLFGILLSGFGFAGVTLD